MIILKRPIGDNYTFRLFVKLINEFKKPKDVFYMWSACIDPNHSRISHFVGTVQFYEDEIIYRNALMSNIKNDLIVIGIKDHLTSKDFNPWVHTKPDMVIYLEDMFNYYHDKKFIVFTSMENLEYYITNSNVTLIPWGGDIVNHKADYEKLDVMIEKDFDSNYAFLSLNRSARHHRIILVSLLYELGLNKFGLISCMFKNEIAECDVPEITGWKLSSEQHSSIKSGFDKLQQSELLLNDDKKSNGNASNANVGNFKGSLIAHYQCTFVEIIAETSYTEKAFNLTEKTLHSIFGQCFPILISSPGTVKFLREMGMDVFDDIVDHSYDLVENPIDRMEQAINLNIKLLNNVEYTKQVWKTNQDRFIKNIDFAKKTMYNFYTARTTEKFHELINL
jgi:hypothetical protein